MLPNSCVYILPVSLSWLARESWRLVAGREQRGSEHSRATEGDDTQYIPITLKEDHHTLSHIPRLDFGSIEVVHWVQSCVLG